MCLSRLIKDVKDRIRTVHSGDILQVIIITVAGFRKWCDGFKPSHHCPPWNSPDLNCKLNCNLVLWQCDNDIRTKSAMPLASTASVCRSPSPEYIIIWWPMPAVLFVAFLWDNDIKSKSAMPLALMSSVCRSPSPDRVILILRKFRILILACCHVFP